jgi:hypothetical protein
MKNGDDGAARQRGDSVSSLFGMNWTPSGRPPPVSRPRADGEPLQIKLGHFLLRCVSAEREVTSSVGADECGRYRYFLATRSLNWTGVSKGHRTS